MMLGPHMIGFSPVIFCIISMMRSESSRCCSSLIFERNAIGLILVGLVFASAIGEPRCRDCIRRVRGGFADRTMSLADLVRSAKPPRTLLLEFLLVVLMDGAVVLIPDYFRY